MLDKTDQQRDYDLGKALKEKQKKKKRLMK